MLAVLLLAFFSCISAQSPPTFSEQFFSIVHVYVDQSGQKSSGKGQWLCNQPEGMNLETYEFDEQKHYHENIFLLQRWDLGSQYELQTGSNKTGCQVTPLTGSMPSLWSWVSLATNTRNITWGHETLLVWSYSAGGAIIEIVVSEYDSNTPRWLFRNSSNENFAIEFRVWQVTDIPSKDFAVPKQCSSTNNLPVKKPSAGSPAAGWTKYMQCDSAWGNDQLGTCNLNICQAGCAMSCVAMALTTKGHSIDPGQLNDWLKSNGGYESGCDIVWSAVDAFGVMKFISMENAAYDTICDGVKAGHAIIINVRDGTHWVLVTGCSGGNYLVNDPYFSVNSYSPGDVLTEAVYH